MFWLTMVCTPHLSKVRFDLCFVIASVEGDGSSVLVVGGSALLCSACFVLYKMLLCQYVPGGGGGRKYLVASSMSLFQVGGSW